MNILIKYMSIKHLHQKPFRAQKNSMTRLEELDESILGTQEYWNQIYEKEVENYKDSGYTDKGRCCRNSLRIAIVNDGICKG